MQPPSPPQTPTSHLHSLEELDEQPGVALHHVGLQLGQRHQLVEQLDEEDVVLLAEPAAVQLQEPAGVGGAGRGGRGERVSFNEGIITSSSCG